MSVKEVMDFITNPSVVAVAGSVIGFFFHKMKVAPKTRVLRAIKAIEDYAPIVFQTVEEMAEMAKKRGDAENNKIDKALEYEKLIKTVVTVYGGIWNDEIKTIAHATAKAIHESSK